MKTYEEARAYMKSMEKYGSVLGLDHMRALMKVLEDPQEDLCIIHIAGTNGKGSVGAYLSAGLREAELNTVRYCSPVVFDPLECWQYNDENITKDEYVRLLSQVKKACDIVALCPENPIHPTSFEIETALAFLYAKEKKADVFLLETGMGGATDATNIIRHPLACVFTSISRDHMRFLGETLPEIAEVKAGIMKAEAMVFSAPQEPEVMSVLDRRYESINPGRECGKVRYVDEDAMHLISQKPGELRFSYRGCSYISAMAGIYQMKNIALAADVLEQVIPKLQKMRFQTPAISDMITKGIAKARWNGRFEVIGTDPLFLMDGAHNPDAVMTLADSIRTSFGRKPVHFIIGIFADKEHEEMLRIMMPYAGTVFTLTPPGPRGLDGRILADEVRRWHKDVVYCEDIETAVLSARKKSSEDGCPIVAFGSLSYLGQLKAYQKQVDESRKKDV